MRIVLAVILLYFVINAVIGLFLTSIRKEGHEKTAWQEGIETVNPGYKRFVNTVMIIAIIFAGLPLLFIWPHKKGENDVSEESKDQSRKG